MRIGIFGAGGFGRELVQPLRLVHPEAELVFIDDTKEGESGGLPVLRLGGMRIGDRYVLAVGDGRVRERLERRCDDAGLVPLTLIDVTARIRPDVEIGPGSVFGFNSLVTASARIGRHFQCNAGSYVSHDCVVGNYVTFAGRVTASGNVHIHDYAYCGSHAVIRNGSSDRPIIIGEGAVVGMGAVVTKDVAPNATVVGNPAREISLPRFLQQEAT